MTNEVLIMKTGQSDKIKLLDWPNSPYTRPSPAWAKYVIICILVALQSALLASSTQQRKFNNVRRNVHLDGGNNDCDSVRQIVRHLQFPRRTRKGVLSSRYTSRLNQVHYWATTSVSQSLDRDLTIAKTIITFFLPLAIIFFAYVGELTAWLIIIDRLHPVERAWFANSWLWDLSRTIMKYHLLRWMTQLLNCIFRPHCPCPHPAKKCKDLLNSSSGSISCTHWQTYKDDDGFGCRTSTRNILKKHSHDKIVWYFINLPWEFIVCWLPHHVLNLLILFKEDFKFTKATFVVKITAHCVSFCHGTEQ